MMILNKIVLNKSTQFAVPPLQLITHHKLLKYCKAL